jgi:hypothetical protein
MFSKLNGFLNGFYGKWNQSVHKERLAAFVLRGLTHPPTPKDVFCEQLKKQCLKNLSVDIPEGIVSTHKNLITHQLQSVHQ